MPLSPCKIWMKYRAPDGYGRVMRKVDGNWTPKLAHRDAWEQAYGPIPDGLFVCHRCDNRACYELSHLFLGSPSDNSSDMVSKGRSLRHRQPKAKLAARQVVEIRCLAGLVPQRSLAAVYGVAQSQISRATTEDRWKCAIKPV